MDEQSKEKSFAVIYLPKESVYSEVPVSWLTDDRAKCWWPKTLNAHNFMKRGDVPNESTWQLHEARVEMYCSTLESARRRAEDPYYTSASEVDRGKGRRKKASLKKYSSSEDSSSYEVTPPPSPPSCPSPTQNNADGPSDAFNCEVAHITDGSIGNTEEIKADTPIIIIEHDVLDAPPNSARLCTNQELYEEIESLKRICLKNQKMLEDLHEKVRSEVKDVQFKENLDRLKRSLPLETIDELTKFNELSEEDQKTFAAFVKSVGGRDLRDNVNRILAKIFSTKLATNCSWYGKRGNFAVRTLLIMKIVVDSMIAAHGTTENTIEKHAIEWFRLSRQRLHRGNKTVGATNV